MRHLLHAAALTTAALAIPASATASPSRPYAYVTDAANGIVDVIDTTTNQVTAGIGVGSDPTDVAITPDGTLAYVVNQGSASVSVIDTALQSVVDTVTLPPGSKPNHIAIAPNGTYAYVSDTGNDCVYAIAIPADTIAATIPITVVQGLGMYGIAVAPNSATVYAVHDQDISVISAATDKVVATIVVGTITSDDFLETFPQIAAVSPDGGTLYVTVSDDLGSGPGALDEISTATNTVTRSVPLPDFTGEGLAIAPDGSRVYAVYGPIGRYNSHVAVINPATATTVAEVPVGQNNNDWSNPFDNAASTPDGGKVLVTNLANFDVSVIDTSTDTVVANVYVGGEPTGIAITPPITPITPAPDITSAPDQATNLTAAQFEFTGNSDECSLDGSDYQACAGAAEYTNLADGPHTFKVREHITGEDPGPDTDYTWSIYTQPPTVEIDSAPTGSGNGATATITFHATAEDGNDSAIAFHCSLDGAAWQPCTSPDSVAGLSDGVHSISVYATDDVGNVSSSAASAAWGVASGPGGTQPPPPSRCSGATLDSVTNGDLTMVAGWGLHHARPAWGDSGLGSDGRGDAQRNHHQTRPGHGRDADADRCRADVRLHRRRVGVVGPAPCRAPAQGRVGPGRRRGDPDGNITDQ